MCAVPCRPYTATPRHATQPRGHGPARTGPPRPFAARQRALPAPRPVGKARAEGRRCEDARVWGTAHGTQRRCTSSGDVLDLGCERSPGRSQAEEPSRTTAEQTQGAAGSVSPRGPRLGREAGVAAAALLRPIAQPRQRVQVRQPPPARYGRRLYGGWRYGRGGWTRRVARKPPLSACVACVCGCRSPVSNSGRGFARWRGLLCSVAGRCVPRAGGCGRGLPGHSRG
jgi:hypothetical protein